MKTIFNIIFAGLVANIALIASGALSAVDLSFVASAADISSSTSVTTSLIAAAPASAQTA